MSSRLFASINGNFKSAISLSVAIRTFVYFIQEHGVSCTLNIQCIRW